MKENIFKILLLISIIFNVTFVGNVIYQKYIKRSSYQGMDYRKNLPNDKLEKFKHYRKEMAKHRGEYVQERREFMEMLMAPNFDEKALKRKLNLTIDRENEMERKMGKHLIELRKEMTPIQARRFFIRILRKRQKGFFENTKKINKRRIKP